jgi:L-aspartate oxidase
MRYGIDPRIAPIPVVAAAHYHMGGIDVDLEGRTSVPGLYACGEVAATGVHGANRLASNSLLESVVYPERIANDVRARRYPARASSAVSHAGAPEFEAKPGDWQALRDEMYFHVGVERDRAGLETAVARLDAMAAATPSRALRDAATVGSLVARAALRRHETRGSHARTDFPALVARERHRSYSSLAELGAAAQPA